jgi:hypothetical protein
MSVASDISATAADFSNSVQWDFRNVNVDWIAANYFVYIHSLDQSWRRKIAPQTWLGQLKPNGLLIIEHTELHGPRGYLRWIHSGSVQRSCRMYYQCGSDPKSR